MFPVTSCAICYSAVLGTRSPFCGLCVGSLAVVIINFAEALGTFHAPAQPKLDFETFHVYKLGHRSRNVTRICSHSGDPERASPELKANDRIAMLEPSRRLLTPARMRGSHMQGVV